MSPKIDPMHAALVYAFGALVNELVEQGGLDRAGLGRRMDDYCAMLLERGHPQIAAALKGLAASVAEAAGGPPDLPH